MVPICSQGIHQKADLVLEIATKKPASKVIDTISAHDGCRVHHAEHEGLSFVGRRLR